MVTIIFHKVFDYFMATENDFALVLFRPTIYKFLRIAKWKKPDLKRVLDCGVGGSTPPGALFSKHGYEVYGIDSSEDALAQSREFLKKYDIDMNLSKEDMRVLPFEDRFFDLVFSYNASIHLTKADTEIAVKEMLRVLDKGGLLCMNFLWHNNVHPSLGEEKNPGEFWNMEHGEETVHSFFTEDEVEQMLEGTKILLKDKVEVKIFFTEEYFWESSFEYIVQKRVKSKYLFKSPLLIGCMRSSFVAEDFIIPAILETQRFRLRMLSVDDVEKDYEAVIESRELLHKMFGGPWPREGFTIEENLEDLKRHQQEFLDRKRFAYTVVSLDETKVLGCLYINPPEEKSGYKPYTLMWVRQTEYEKGLDEILFHAVKEWIKSCWPFEEMVFPGRE